MAQIITLFGVFENLSQLKSYSEASYLALQSAEAKIKKQDDEIKHLQSLLATTAPIIGENKIEKLLVSKEQALLEDQIHILYNRSLEKEFTLEEAKKLDLFLKNLNLIKGKATGIIDTKSKKVSQQITEAQLIQIASTPMPSDE